jgi:hypothetical protein
MAAFQVPVLPEWALTRNDAEAIAVMAREFGDDPPDAYRANATLPGAMKAMVDYYRANFANRPQAVAVTKDADRADADDLG